MSLINITNLTFSHDGSYDNIFENVSFQISSDWKLGFTGRNGRGKTTFLNLLLGKHEYSGTISSSVRFDCFPFEVPDKTQNTIDIVYSINEGLALWELHRELSLLDVSKDVLYRPFGTLSPGEQTKVLLAGLFLKENNFLLIDEPTNHLDAEARMKVSSYLKSQKGFILVSHDRAFLDNCIDHVLSINKTNIEIQKGNFSSWWSNKKGQDAFEFAENDKLQRDIKKLSSAAKRTSAWSDNAEKSKNRPLSSGLSADKGYIGHKAAKLMKRSKEMEKRQQKAIEEKSKLLTNIETADKLCMKPLHYPAHRLVEISDLSIFYDGKIVCENVNMEINRGDRIALRGKNGSGKSSVLKLLVGEDISFRGSVRAGNGLVVSYVSQDTSFLRGNLKEFARNNHMDESLFKTILRKLDFSRVQFEKELQNFSGGQKKKVLLAKSLCEEAHLYIWDEPLNFIDVFSRMQIEELLLEYKPTLLFVEHDGAFVHTITTKIVAL